MMDRQARNEVQNLSTEIKLVEYNSQIEKCSSYNLRWNRFALATQEVLNFAS
jgi:hypothetical protein